MALKSTILVVLAFSSCQQQKFFKQNTSTFITEEQTDNDTQHDDRRNINYNETNKYLDFSPQSGLIKQASATFDAEVRPHPKIADFWANKVMLENYIDLTLENTGWSSGFMGGAHVYVLNNTWYLFGRVVNWKVPSYCEGRNVMLETQVRKSTDYGKTWSEAIKIIPKKENTAWECAATDGDIYFDASKQIWHYLFQCQSRERSWKGCHLVRKASDPFGEFTDPHSTGTNPVVKPRDLWDKVCNEEEDHCVKLAGNKKYAVFDEGTFDFIDFKDSHYYIGFHGTDGKLGFRGIAKTSDFIHWTAGDPKKGTPSDAIFDAYDANKWAMKWQEGSSIGGGAGRTYKEGDYYYLIIEAADLTLNCDDAQQWAWGIYRSKDLTSTNWESPTRLTNPFFDLKPDFACDPSYLGLFTDNQGRTFMHYSRKGPKSQYGLHFLQLIWKEHLVQHIAKGGELYTRTNRLGKMSEWINVTDRLPYSDAGGVTGFSTLIHPLGYRVQHFIRGGRIFSRNSKSGWSAWKEETDHVMQIGCREGVVAEAPADCGLATGFNSFLRDDGVIVQHIIKGGRVFAREKQINKPWPNKWDEVTDNLSNIGNGNMTGFSSEVEPRGYIVQHFVRDGEVFSRNNHKGWHNPGWQPYEHGLVTDSGQITDFSSFKSVEN